MDVNSRLTRRAIASSARRVTRVGLTGAWI